MCFVWSLQNSILKGTSFLTCNPPGGTFQKLSRDAIFTMCSHTFTLLWLRKTSVIVTISQLSFHVFVCVFPPDISLVFGKSFPFLFDFLFYLNEFFFSKIVLWYGDVCLLQVMKIYLLKYQNFCVTISPIQELFMQIPKIPWYKH